MGILRSWTLSIVKMRTVRQNFFLDFAYNVEGTLAGPGGRYSFLSLLLSPVVAPFAMGL